MPKIIVTPGNIYADIDGLACAIAYAELLRREGKDAIAVCAGNLNASIPPFLQKIAKNYSSENIQGTSYVFVDTSDIAVISRCSDIEKVVEIYDHHFSDMDFWKEKLGENAIIEPIGAAATLIYEAWKLRDHPENMSKESASLLAYAILSNTVNFQLSLTCDRDREALDVLESIAGLTGDWKEHYFQEQQHYIEQDPRFAIENDIKRGSDSYAFGQIEIWDSEHFRHSVDIERIFQDIGHEAYFMNIIDIQKGYSLILSNRVYLLEKLGAFLNIPIVKNTLHLPHLMLRKEIYPIIK